MEDVAARFATQTATAAQQELLVRLQRAFIEIAIALDDVLPNGREKSLALTHLEDASMRVSRSVLGF